MEVGKIKKPSFFVVIECPHCTKDIFMDVSAVKMEKSKRA